MTFMKYSWNGMPTCLHVLIKICRWLQTSLLSRRNRRGEFRLAAAGVLGAAQCQKLLKELHLVGIERTCFDFLAVVLSPIQQRTVLHHVLVGQMSALQHIPPQRLIILPPHRILPSHGKSTLIFLGFFCISFVMVSVLGSA